MESNYLTWKHVAAYLGAICVSACLLTLGSPPEIAAVPSVLMWVLMRDKLG